MSQLRFRHMTSVYLTQNGRFLLLYRVGSRVIAPSWTGTAGGHMEERELSDPQACALRELFEETGLTAEDIEGLALRYVTLRQKNGEIRQNYYYFAELKPQAREIASNEGKLCWFTAEEMHDLPMPHTARYVIDHYLAEGLANSLLYGGIAVPDGCVFTELQNF